MLRLGRRINRRNWSRLALPQCRSGGYIRLGITCRSFRVRSRCVGLLRRVGSRWLSCCSVRRRIGRWSALWRRARRRSRVRRSRGLCAGFSSACRRRSTRRRRDRSAASRSVRRRGRIRICRTRTCCLRSRTRTRRTPRVRGILQRLRHRWRRFSVFRQPVKPSLFPVQVSESSRQNQSDYHHRQLAPAPLRLFFIFEQIIHIARGSSPRIVAAPVLIVRSLMFPASPICRLIQAEKGWSMNHRA